MKRPYLLVWALCLLGTLCIIPYVVMLTGLSYDVTIASVIAITMLLQAVLLYGFFCWAAKKLVPKTDLQPFKLLTQNAFYTSVLAGLITGLGLFVANQYIFAPTAFTPAPPRWVGVLASVYGGVNEEVFMRLFLFTLFYFLMGKCIRINEGNRSIVLWSVTAVIALIFGIGHLPAAAALAPLTAPEVSRILILNSIGGIVFGWLYWSRGLWAAMIAHFIADLVLHVFLQI